MHLVLLLITAVFQHTGERKVIEVTLRVDCRTTEDLVDLNSAERKTGDAAMLKKPTHMLKGNSHQILLSKMSLPGVEVLIEKLLPKILGRLGKENPSKRQCKVAFVQRKCAVTSTVSVRFLYASYN